MFRGNLTEGREEGTYLLGNRPKGSLARDWRLSACTNTDKKELNTFGYNDNTDTSFLAVWSLSVPKRDKRAALSSQLLQTLRLQQKPKSEET